ncbi:MAG: DUF4442 domain-containing protein [Leptospiraceae bacterium]|nr:DUF4442 domain-containing protein [Leptospiraceae bacterium]
MAKKSLSYQVHPIWKFLSDTYGMEESFKLFSPFAGANIIPKLIDNQTIDVEMPLVLANTNYVGTHFGGSLYSMCDPFYMFILMNNLGDSYMVWDKSAKIEFLKPGTGTVKVRFHIPLTEIEEIKSILTTEKKITRFYEAEVKNENGTLVAKVIKELYIRKM